MLDSLINMFGKLTKEVLDALQEGGGACSTLPAEG